MSDGREIIPNGYARVWRFPWRTIRYNWLFWDYNKREYCPTEFAGWRMGDICGVEYIRPKSGKKGGS
jgi:hypothetical protein